MQKKLKLLCCGLIALSAPAFAAENPAGKYKSKGPIEITSDSLEVLQQENKAIFTGHVIAVQGDIRLKSEKMTVFYKSSNKKTDKDQKPTTVDSAVSEKNSIEKIIVEKKVFLSTPEETASGASGLYDVVGHKIYLNDNVVLTKDKNVLKGTKLVYDFATGKSELTSTSTTGAAGNGKTGQRVKALFTPENNKKLPSKD